MKYDDRETEIFNKGYDAYNEGVELQNNPFKKTTIDYGLWEEGWYEAMNDEYRQEVNGC